MTKNNKFMLSMATIAILSGTNAVATELKVDGSELQLGTEKVEITGGVANVAPKTGEESNPIDVKSAIPSTIGSDKMTKLDITAPKAELKVGDGTTDAKASIGGTKPTGEASTDGYGFTIDASKVTLTGKSETNNAELNVNQNSSIKTSDTTDGTKLGANSAINIANGKTLTIDGALTTSDDTSNISINGGSLNLNGALTATKGSISLSKSGSLTTSGALNANGATISLGEGTLTTNGDLTAGSGTINLESGSLTANGALNVNKGSKITFGEGGTLTINKALGGDTKETNKFDEAKNDFVTGAKGSAFDFSKGGTLILAAPKSEETGINITGIGDANALKLNKGTIVLKDSSVLASVEEINAKDNSTNHTGKIQLNGGTLATTKVSADASNFDFSNGGLLYFGNKLTAMDTSKGTAQTNTTGSTITGKTTLNSRSGIGFGADSWVHYDEIDTNNGTLKFTGGTLNVTNLATSGTSLNFDATNGGTIELANGGKSTISGNLELGTGANIKIISAAASATAGTLGVDKLSVTKTGKITLGGGNLNVAQGLNIANAGATADSEGNANNIDISAGGVINFNGGISNINGKLETTESEKLTLDVNQNAGVNFEDLSLKKGSELSLDGGIVNVGKLTTAEAGNLSLAKGTLNFIGKVDEKGEIQAQKSSLTGFADILADSEAIINFNNGSEVSIISAAGAVDLDLSATKANVNFNNGSLVKLGTDSKGTLTAGAGKSLYLGGQVELGTLVAKSSADSSLLNVGFGGANASLSGKLVGKDSAKFTIGTDKDGNSLIGVSGEKVEIGEGSTNSALTLKAGTITTDAALTTATNSKLIFGGGSLNIGENGSLTITNTGNNLELKEGVGGVITLKGNGAQGGLLTISEGALDLSKTTLGIKIENGGKLTTTKASKISGVGNVIALSDYTAIGINGDITTAASSSSSAAFEYNKMGDLTLGKDTTLIINTRQNADGNLQEITAGKFSTADSTNTSKFNTATLAFGTGSVKLTGEIQKGTAPNENKLNNSGFASGLTLADKSVLEFASGSVDVKGALGVEASKTATLKVSGARANLNGGFDTTNYVKTIELNNGALNIKQDTLTASGLDVTHIQTNASGISSTMNIDGSATITTSKFAILPVGVETGATSYQVLSTTKGLTISDLNAKGGTTGEFRTRNSLNKILEKYGLTVADSTKIKDGDKVISAKDSSVDAWLRNDGKNLFLERQLTNLSSLSAVKESKIQADIDMLTAMAGDTDIVDNNDKEQVENLKTELEAVKKSTANRSNAELATEIGGANSDILLSAFGVSSGATSAQTRNAVALDILENGGAGLVADIKEGASSVANMSSSTSSVMNTINLSNDMAISGRIAQANNPFASYASFDGLLYAAVEGDLPLYYANNGYMNGFWANAIGGLNKVEGEGGTLVGLSVGFDRQLENTLVGFYLSYAMAGLNDKIVEQGSDNIQVGVYTSFNQRDIEVNVKAYGQLAVTETTAKRGTNGEAEAKFNRLYAGLSANIGAIFAFNNNKTFVKPYVGENYYYAHTPAYEETRDSDAALSVQSANNHALSFDVGVDVRQYWNENSFVYLTPSIERYVVNSGGDYTAGFIGSDTSFTIEGKSKTKTYGQVLLGGNIALGDKFNINLGVGVKKILNGQITRDNGDKVDEMYLSGNLGVKYRF